MTKIIPIEKASILKEKLLNNGYIETKQNNKYVIWSLKNGKSTIVYYSSKKLYANSSEDLILSLLDERYESTIGADESGKGDYFGPLVLCAVYLPKEKYNKIYKMNVRDSKSAKDSIIGKIINDIEVDYELKILNPQYYNSKFKQEKNLNKLLTLSYVEIISRLKERTKCKRIVIDAYQKSEYITKAFPYNVIALTKAENKELAVALASMIARHHFTKELQKLSDEYGLIFPKGSSNIMEFAKEFVQKFGYEELKKVAKIHFVTTQKITKALNLEGL